MIIDKHNVVSVAARNDLARLLASHGEWYKKCKMILRQHGVGFFVRLDDVQILHEREAMIMINYGIPNTITDEEISLWNTKFVAIIPEKEPLGNRFITIWKIKNIMKHTSKKIFTCTYKGAIEI